MSRTSLLRRATLSLALALLLPVSAHAHGGHGHGHGTADAARHAKQDLAGVSVDKLLRGADRRAGLRSTAPGRARRLVTGPASTVGTWGPVRAMPVVPVFAAMLPNGKILMWDSVGDAPAESYSTHTYTRAAVWSPSAGTSKRVDVQGYNIFCAGFSHLPNGNVLVVGGNADRNLAGIRQTHIFDWQTERWSRGPDMSSARWYPSVASQADGSQLVIGGGPSVGELYRAGAIKNLPGVTTGSSRQYPLMQLTASGRTLFSDMSVTGHEVSIAAGGAVAKTGTTSQIYGDYGSYAQYDIGKTLFAGGSYDASSKAGVVDTTAGSPVLRTAAPMTSKRRQHTLTVLADGSVIATGGLSTRGLVDLRNATYEAERWNPATGAWSRLASALVARQYHSVATLLPDGRVYTGGGGICGECSSNNYLRRDAEIYSPPYLYAKDGSGRAAVRPRIAAAPGETGYDEQFWVTTPNAQTITKVGLVRLGAPTHGQDQDQRYVPLTFRSIGDELEVDGPRNAFEAPPGYYMLFIVNADGVPSVSTMLRVDRIEPPTAGTGFAAAAASTAVNLALDRPATSSAACATTQLAAKAVNGSVNQGRADKWCGKSTVANKWWQVDLGGNRSLTSVVLRHAQAGGEAASLNTRSYTVQTSPDGANWTTVADVTTNTAASTTHSFTSRSARYVRVNVRNPTQTSADRYARLFEVEVYGIASSTPEPSSYAALEAAAVLYPQAARGGAVHRLEAGAHDVARGNQGPARSGIRSIEIAAGYRARVCGTGGLCVDLDAGVHDTLPAGISGDLRSAAIQRVRS